MMRSSADLVVSFRTGSGAPDAVVGGVSGAADDPHAAKSAASEAVPPAARKLRRLMSLCTMVAPGSPEIGSAHGVRDQDSKNKSTVVGAGAQRLANAG
jgi:hypothetical protein